MAFNVAPSSQALEASFLMGNSSGVAKPVIVYLNSRTGGFAGSVSCPYVVPANTPLTAYRLIGPVGTGWTGTGVAFQIVFQAADNASALLLDDVIVRHHTGTNVSLNCTWNGVLPGASGLSEQGVIVMQSEQLPGLPDGWVPLPPPMVTVTPEPPAPTLEATPEPAPTETPLPVTPEPTLVPVTPELTVPPPTETPAPETTESAAG
jgi:hypothetical protein